MPSEYHQKIIEYYNSTEHAYRDSWDLDNSLAIHYGYWDEKVRSFPQSLLRMNEIMIEAVNIQSTDKVLDAGCGVGGSSILIASRIGAKVTGITINDKQVKQAVEHAKQKGVGHLVEFKNMNYCATNFDDASFDVVWGCESICYADNKEQFIQEAFRLLKPGGRLVVADGFVSRYEYNQDPVIRKWLDGWQVNYLESPGRFQHFMETSGFTDMKYRDITPKVLHSARRLKKFYYLANLYLLWKTLSFSNRATDIQKQNIQACKYQFLGLKKGLWQYGLISGKKR